MKKLFWAILFASASTVICSSVHADDDLEPRNVKMAQLVCEACHGAGGVNNNALFPNLGGQHPAYLERELKMFRDRTRGDPFAQAYMWGMAGPLSDAEIADLAAYFAAKPPAPGVASAMPEVLDRGKQLFDNGDDAQGIPACQSCHGENAEGNEDFPRLAGQHADYLFRQIEAFRSSTRRNSIMHVNTYGMKDDDARALAEYLSSK